MDNTPAGKTLAQHRRAFNLKWSQMPARQRPTSSSWWFFLLFPRDEEGYGPRQLMFTIASRVGHRIRISDVWLPGIDLKRQVEDGVDRFHAVAVGWYCDGKQVYEDVVKETAEATLSTAGFIQCWAEHKDGPRDLEICASSTHSLGLAARIKGEKGEAHFELRALYRFTTVAQRLYFFPQQPLGAGHAPYNEYMVRLQRPAGRIQGQPISTATMGQGFGSLEYTWGLGL